MAAATALDAKWRDIQGNKQAKDLVIAVVDRKAGGGMKREKVRRESREELT